MSEPTRHDSGLPAFEGYTSPPPPGAGGLAVEAEPSQGRYVLAGWWSRVAATLLDGIVIGIGAALVMLIFGSAFSVGFFDGEDSGAASIAVGLTIGIISTSIIALLYAPLMMTRTNGKTLGGWRWATASCGRAGRTIDARLAVLREVLVKALLFGFIGSHHVWDREPGRRAVAALGRREPRATRLRGGHAHGEGLAAGCIQASRQVSAAIPTASSTAFSATPSYPWGSTSMNGIRVPDRRARRR